ncbi:MAG TPA: DUF4147 domain-containing protein [Gemmatimonadaceae bacterium]|nr:DUF4147 domain-containing protein [Gemmatimonadaceae bacterium]
MSPDADPRAFLRVLYDAAIEGAAPEPAVRRALERIELGAHRRTWILALGKAAEPMTAAAIALLTERDVVPEGGIVVPPSRVASPHTSLLVFPGEHPIPGPGSLAAAEAIGAVADRVSAGDLVLVLLSGGASSLAAAPVDRIEPAELSRLFELLLGSGLDIARMNIVRKRFVRWGAGRLAAALAPATVRCLAISDVPGDDLAAIGSGPCVPDPTTTPDVARILRAVKLLALIPESLCTYLSAVEQGEASETPKADDPAFADVRCEIVASNIDALARAAERARSLGIEARIVGATLAGQAAARGEAIARALVAAAESGTSGGHAPRRAGDGPPSGPGISGGWLVELHGGETTVTLGVPAGGRRGSESPGTAAPETGRGGRSQELALAAARVLDEAGERADGITILAAGTDGRDGPTDAAGAIVDRHSWSAARAAGRDPARDLAKHDAYAALDAAGALLRTGPTGTNVMDVVFAVRAAT